MQVLENQSLFNYNTFGINAKARYLAICKSLNDITATLTDFNKQQKLVLGGGSNILFVNNFDGIVIKNELKGIEVTEYDNYYSIKAHAGEVWHDLVLFCIQNNYAGIENMSLIPGCVGAAPIQNIGAYGVELMDVFDSLEALHIPTLEKHSFSKNDCEFGYRNSVFKNKFKNQYIILSINLKLPKKPNFKIEYGAIEKKLEEMNITDLSIKHISNAVISIRQSKLPDPNKIGNGGSFFKNPIISLEKANQLKSKFENIPTYSVSDNEVKVAAAWLIEKVGWKGKTFDNYGVHKNQALVLVNYGGASGKNIYNLSEEIIESVKSKFDIQLEREINVI